jgi:DNA-binding transcriptional LysR family regulator
MMTSQELRMGRRSVLGGQTEIAETCLVSIHLRMTQTQPGWELYRSFLAVIREGSLSAAARRLNLTQPTIGRHIEALEQALGVALFTRSPHGLAPNSAALELVPHAEAMAAAAEALIRTASGEAEAVRGTVRVTVGELVGVEILPGILTSFHECHPGIAIELALTNRNEDLLRHEADIAVRMARPTQSALVARRIGTVEIGLYAHRRYIAAHGMPTGIADAAAHTVIGVDRDLTFLRRVVDLGIPLERETFSLRTDNDLAQLAALRAGYGIGGCQTRIAAREPDLVRVADDVIFRLELWVVTHEDLRGTRRVRLLFDYLVTALQDYVAER